MRIEDLMVGDWVICTYPSINKPVKVMEIKTVSDEELKAVINNDGIRLVFRRTYIDPIPLTPEILEKNGFGKFDFPDIEKQHKWFLRLDTLSYISLWTRELNDNSSSGWMCNIEKQSAVSGCFMIVYTHELQHLLKLVGINKEIQI